MLGSNLIPGCFHQSIHLDTRTENVNVGGIAKLCNRKPSKAFWPLSQMAIYRGGSVVRKLVLMELNSKIFCCIFQKYSGNFIA